MELESDMEVLDQDNVGIITAEQPEKKRKCTSTCARGSETVSHNKRSKTTTRKKKRNPYFEPGADMIYSTFGQVEGRNFVFSESGQTYIDGIARQYGGYLKHQADKRLPQTFFAQGHCSATKLAAHEKPGVLLMWILVLSLTLPSKLIVETQGMNTSRCGSCVLLLENLLGFEEWSK